MRAKCAKCEAPLAALVPGLTTSSQRNFHSTCVVIIAPRREFSYRKTNGGKGRAGDRMDGWSWVPRYDKGAPALKSGETRGDGFNGVISVRRRPKVEKHLESGPTV
ncbi:hypothetical protein Y032_0152g2858 [Ancylostoma ceylanicum]|uniref:Uncharacterized protein n=1 Tax=Ancylostoma ceylanicum TaxID=53326 RepID=A0A016T0M9_9BILA|nr:hypothetical protein Y032_0152g2858 [Ancylostoma ceylanicum]